MRLTAHQNEFSSTDLNAHHQLHPQRPGTQRLTNTRIPQPRSPCLTFPLRRRRRQSTTYGKPTPSRRQTRRQLPRLRPYRDRARRSSKLRLSRLPWTTGVAPDGTAWGSRSAVGCASGCRGGRASRNGTLTWSNARWTNTLLCCASGVDVQWTSWSTIRALKWSRSGLLHRRSLAVCWWLRRSSLSVWLNGSCHPGTRLHPLTAWTWCGTGSHGWTSCLTCGSRCRWSRRVRHRWSTRVRRLCCLWSGAGRSYPGCRRDDGRRVPCRLCALGCIRLCDRLRRFFVLTRHLDGPCFVFLSLSSLFLLLFDGRRPVLAHGRSVGRLGVLCVPRRLLFPLMVS